MFLLFSLLLRFPNPTGESAYLEFLQISQLPAFLKKNKRSVVIFEEAQYMLDFMNYGIMINEGKIGFVTCNISGAEKYGCKTSPCFMPFEYEKPIQMEAPVFSPVHFAEWLEHVKEPRQYKVKRIEELRIIFERHEPIVIGVDLTERPENITDGIPFYLADAKLFEEFQIYNLTKGLYIYRYADRQFIPMTSDYETMSKTPITDLSTNPDAIVSKPFFGGFVLHDKSTVDEYQLEIDILTNLANKYTDKINLIAQPKSLLKDLIDKLSLKKAKPPYFFVFNSTNISSEYRYVVVEKEQQHDIKYLEKFLEDIFEGKLNSTTISQRVPNEPPDLTFRCVVTSNFKDKILNESEDALVVVTAPWCHHCKDFKPVLNVTSQLLRNITTIKFYWMDGTKNEYPPELPNFRGFPTLFLYPAGRKNETDAYDGERDVPGLISYLTANATTKFEPPTYNETEILTEIERLRKIEHGH